MAEVAALVIGGVALTGLFESAMNAFDRIESEAKYGRKFNRCALKKRLLKLCLSRWEGKIRWVEELVSI